MTRTDDWRLTIHFWPQASAAGVRPQPFTGFNFENDSAAYRPHDIDFSHPPSRADFDAVVSQTPWMHGWRDSLMPVIANSEWPMITAGYKGAASALTDGGAVVGRLEVWRRERYCNTPYSVPMLCTYRGSDVDRFLTRRIRDRARREQAREYVIDHRNLILERIALAENTSTRVLDVIADVLTSVGLMRGTKRHGIAA